MSDVVEVLQKTRTLYAHSPSHVPWGESVAPGTHCLMTALDASVGRNDFDAWLRARAYIKDAARPNTNNLVRFSAENSTEKVIAVLDKAIDLATIGGEPGHYE